MADFDYQRNHSRAFYAPSTTPSVKKGQVFWCHSKDDEAVARERGFTSDRYVTSEWPKTVYNKKTGESKTIGKLEWTDKQNLDAVKNLGVDWGFDYVAPPEPAKASASGPELSGPDISALAAIMADQKLLVKRIEDLEDAATQAEAVRIALESRIQELEQDASDPKK